MFLDTRKSQLEELTTNLGFKSVNLELLNIALTHPSFTFENNFDRLNSYERLEFLGDSVLKLAVSRMLYDKFPEYNEGDLTHLRSLLVSDSFIEKLARKINLDQYIQLGEHEKKQGGLNRQSTLACAFESFLGALYLDGQFHQLYNFLSDLYYDFKYEIKNTIKTYNSKAILQEYTQAQTQELPEYQLLTESGLAHQKSFAILVLYQNEVLGEGTGASKKEAQQNAATQACIKLGLIEKRNDKTDE